MKIYLKKILFFLSPILLVIVVCEILLINIPNDYEYKKKYLDKNAEKIETLIFGTSHTFAGIMPSQLDGNAFNVAIGGQSLSYDYQIFKKYQKSFNNLNTIVLAFSYYTLWFEQKSHERSAALIFNYEKYYDIDSDRDNTNFNLEILNRPFEYNIKMISHYYIKNKPVKISDEFGWGKKLKRGNLKKTAALQIKRQDYGNINSKRNIKLMQENIRIFNSIIQWSKANDVNVLLLTAPAHHYYYDNLNQEQLEKTISVATELAMQNDNCMYLNLLKDPRFQDIDFRDAHHVSITGAEKLSKIVNLKIKEFD